MTTAPLGKLSENPSILAYMNAQHELPMKHHIALLATLMLSALVPVHAAENRPALWAVYYAWYETGTGPHGRWRMWSDDQTKTAKPKPNSKAQPLIGYYDSDDPNVVRWHVRLAKAAGIDAFLVSWWGGANISGQAFEKVLLPVAAEEDFKVAVCSELAQFHHDLTVLTRQMSDVLTSVVSRIPGRRFHAPSTAWPPGPVCAIIHTSTGLSTRFSAAGAIAGSAAIHARRHVIPSHVVLRFIVLPFFKGRRLSSLR
jgi:hypothetical protein